MYIWRAYQSPASTADCGPQCAQMPNLASRNHSGIWYLRSDARVPSNGPLSIELISLKTFLLEIANVEFNCIAGTPKAILFKIFLLETGIDWFLMCNRYLKEYKH